MARTRDNSLDYFPLDVSYFSDSRIRRLRGRFGSDGPMFLLYIYCRCYGDKGYYLVADNDFFEDAALDIGCTTEKIGLMLNYLLDRSLLDSKLFSTVKVLTSHGIQNQYQKSKKGCKRGIEVSEALWILEKSETEEFIKVCPENSNLREISDNSENYSDNSENYPQSKVKQSKVNNKVNKTTTTSTSRSAEANEAPVDADFAKVMNLYMDRVQALPSSTCVALLQSYTASLGADVVCHAIEKALDDNKRSWAYIHGILRIFNAQGLKSLEDVQRAEEEFAQARMRNNSQKGYNKNSKPVHEEDPDRFAEEWRQMQKTYEMICAQGNNQNQGGNSNEES